jgi:hypothetical protein
MTLVALRSPDHPTTSPRFALPPRLHTDDGRVRRVGVEIEFAGLDVEQASRLVRDLFGGRCATINRFGTEVRGTSLGDFRVEIDSMPLKNEAYKGFLDKVGAGRSVTGIVEDVIEAIATTWIPAEIVTAPIAIEDLHELEVLRWALHAHNAEGTGASILYTFGFQLNPEVPALDAPTLTRYLKAVLALYGWLAAVVDVDPTRRVAAFTEPFPDAYRAMVLEPDYAPDLDRLIDDYLEHNPTRNRALDMLPVFATLRKERVLAVAKERDQIKARPTFHYRLPNCMVDDPSWSFATEWNRWVEIERLAEDAERLDGIAREILAAPGAKMERSALLDRARSWGVTTP